MSIDGSDVSVVICAYTEERWGALVNAVGAVAAGTVSPLEIIIVVDHNPTLATRATEALSHVQVTENTGARGLGGARNSGLALARGAVVAFLDDDTIASPTWLERLVEPYADPTVAGVGGGIEPLWESGRQPHWFPDEFRWVVGCSYRGLPDVPAAVRNLIGCNMSYRRSLFDLAGRFRLGYGCDETEFCIRALRAVPDAKLLYVPAASVQHIVPAARARFGYFGSRCWFEGGSKAVVAWIAGSGAGLASERAYTLRVLPAGVARGARDAAVGRDRTGLARAATIVAGLCITAAGYACGTLTPESAARARGFHPSDRDADVATAHVEASL